MLQRLSRSKLEGLVLFGIVGGIGTVVGLSSLYFLTTILGLFYLLSNCISFVCAVTSNYYLNTVWTFKKNEGIEGYFRYMCVSLTTLGLSTGLLYLFTDRFGLYYMLSAVISIVCIFPINFALSKLLVWRSS